MATATATETETWTNPATADAWQYLNAPVIRDDGFDVDRFSDEMSDIFGATPEGRGEYRRVAGRFERYIRAEHGHRFAPGVDFREIARAFADFYMFAPEC